RGKRTLSRSRKVVREGRGRSQGERPDRRGHDGQGHRSNPSTGHGKDPPASSERRRGRQGRQHPGRVRRSGRNGPAPTGNDPAGLGSTATDHDGRATGARSLRGGPRGTRGPPPREGTQRE